MSRGRSTARPPWTRIEVEEEIAGANEIEEEEREGREGAGPMEPGSDTNLSGSCLDLTR